MARRDHHHGYLVVGLLDKAKWQSCLLLEAASKSKTKVVDNTAAGIGTMLAWTAKPGVPCEPLHVVMDATGGYHEHAAQALFEAGVRVSVVKPAQAKNFARGLAVRTKTDGVDSLVLAPFGTLLKPTGGSPPAPVHELQALLARREAVAQDLRRERNRRGKALATTTPERIRHSIADTRAVLKQALTTRQQAITDHLDRHPSLKADLDLLTSLPAVGPPVGNHLLAILQSHAFPSAESLAAYLGLVPIERQSGTSVFGRARLSQSGPPRVRAIWYLAAVVAVRCSPHVKALYDRLLARGKPKMAARGAAMRKLVHLCFGVIKNRTPYQADYAFSA